MKFTEYQTLKIKLDEDYEKLIHDLRLKYALSNAEYEVGQYVVCNNKIIILIESISYEDYFDHVEITYSGYKYKKNKNVITKTKDKNIFTI